MIHEWIAQLHLPEPTSHKGQNGKAVIVGGSDLFHAASQWSFTVVSRMVDMAFYASTSENNEIFRDLKARIHDGVVVVRRDVPAYVREADVVLIGPGMRRDVPTHFSGTELARLTASRLSDADWESDTTAIVAALLHDFPQKRWVIDAGALQVVQADWLPRHTILTPHRQELERVLASMPALGEKIPELARWQAALRDEHWTVGESLAAHVLTVKPPSGVGRWLHEVATALHGATLLIKGPVDIAWDARKVVAIVGGNAGLTKGGTGDVLAGLVTGFAANSPALASVVVASFLNKQAGHDLYTRQGMLFNTSDVVEQIPLTWRALLDGRDASS